MNYIDENEIEALVKAGDAQAIYEAAEAYLHGRGVKIDLDKAEEWDKKYWGKI